MVDALACAGRIARFRTLMAERGYDAAIIRNNPDLRWFTGAERTFDDETAHTAFVTQDGLWLHTDSRYYNTFLTRLGPDTPWRIDMDIVDPARWAAARVLETRSHTVAVEDTLDLAFFDDLSDECRRASVACLMPRMHGDVCDLRKIKDAEEIELMRHAQATTDAAFDHICGFIKPGLTEQQIRAELENYMLMNGADALSFDSIIATGANGANPHAQPGETVVREGDLIVMDYGAGYHDYHSDMTRTVPVNGKFTPRQRAVYESVLNMMTYAKKILRPGILKSEYERLVRVFAAGELVKLGLITPAQVAEKPSDPPIVRKYYMHGCSHFLGLDVHDVGETNPVVLPGMVFTIEPGIYIAEEGIGIRLENDILIGEKENIDLLGDVPLLPDDIERLMAR